MNRVHGDKILRRRTEYTHYSDYQKYSNILKEDFQNTCGYCGKDMNIISCPAQKDHLIPEKECKKHGRLDLISDYNNLVYSCRVCNRNKWDNWPLNNIDNINDGKTGYVDPATSDFDKTLCRNNKGEIISLTDVGNYMYNILNFSNRLTDIWWKISKINKTIDEIDEMLDDDVSDNKLKEYRQLHKKVKEFTKLLKQEKEMI